jgi:hypothetical protein
MKKEIDLTFIPRPLRHAVKSVLLFPRRMSSGGRVLPDFIIIGGQKCGTKSLYNYLIRHPNCLPAFEKEVHFFDYKYHKGLRWYRANFPTAAREERLARSKINDMIAGEASPYYIFHPHAPGRIAADIPGVKLIALLRNPVYRAYSHYQHEVRKGHENLSFQEAIEREEERLQGELERLMEDEEYYSFDHQHYSYLARGAYADQLRGWLDCFPREQMMIIKSEDMYDDPSHIFTEVQAFLGLPQWDLGEYQKFNYAAYGGMKPEIRERLAEYFEPHNRELYELLGRDFAWEDQV